MSSVLQQLPAARAQGHPEGIYSVCSAHPWVLEAAIEQALDDGTPLLIEATCNQVNHQGGYTGMQPEDFGSLVSQIADRKGLARGRVILGGDHLGPNPWRNQPASQAMNEAARMIEAYVKAGFQKIHLDTSMTCADDTTPLSGETVARRAAALCAIAERAAGESRPVYVIGTEVPVPGGSTESLSHIAVTGRDAVEETLSTHRRVFLEAGLGQAWQRVMAVVVQPGVEFNHDSVIDYQPARAAHLSAFLDEKGAFVYEAHSTDYQCPKSLHRLVKDGFAILKVGPALTFAMREALEALACIEVELVGSERSSRLIETLDGAMLENPQYWRQYYDGGEKADALWRRYSYSDRVRYYWSEPGVKRAVETLLQNLWKVTIPDPMLSAYLPNEYRAVREGTLGKSARELVSFHVRQVLADYAKACR